MRNMKKILIIVPYRFLPASSGGHRYIEGWINALANVAKVTVIGTEDNQVVPNAPYRLLPVLSTSIFRYADYTLKGTIKELIARNQYDFLIWEHPYYAWLAHLIKKETGIPFLLHTHNIEHQRFQSLGKWWWPLLKAYEKWAFDGADRISFITSQDKEFAVEKWAIEKAHCLEIPYGVTQKEHPKDREETKAIICERHQIEKNTFLILFNGPLQYQPNREALEVIISKIEPQLRKKLVNYRIIICGGDIPKRWKFRSEVERSPYINAGFVKDIEQYIKAAQVLINPIQKGGGVKTKSIEAIAVGTPVVTTINGAIGIDTTTTGTMLQVASAENWIDFAEKIYAISTQNENQFQTPTSFYDHYNWNQIIERTIDLLPN
ncbi:MAG: glycosyltransferase [Chitinophagia bacterium]|nr:glycosyltransferase [Chitinophagia bacterium]